MRPDILALIEEETRPRSALASFSKLTDGRRVLVGMSTFLPRTNKTGTFRIRRLQGTPFKRRYLVLDGVSQTAEAWADQLGTTTEVIRKRLVRKWSLQKALTTKLLPKAYTYRGYTLNLKELAKKLKIPYSALYSRVAVRSLTVPEALKDWKKWKARYK